MTAPATRPTATVMSADLRIGVPRQSGQRLALICSGKHA